MGKMEGQLWQERLLWAVHSCVGERPPRITGAAPARTTSRGGIFHFHISIWRIARERIRYRARKRGRARHWVRCKVWGGTVPLLWLLFLELGGGCPKRILCLLWKTTSGAT